MIFLVALALATPLSASVPADALPSVETPGVANPAVTQQTLASTICQPRQPGHATTWIHDQRPPTSYTNAIKRRLFVELHLSGTIRDFELDHRLPIEDGGNPTDPRNLWMEPWAGAWGARVKDRLETEIHRRICSGRMTLDQARQMLTGSTSWVDAYRVVFGH